MANTSPVQFKRSSVPGKIPAANTISVGELALNLTDKIIYSKDVSGNVISFTDPTTALNALLAYNQANTAYSSANTVGQNLSANVSILTGINNTQNTIISLAYNQANSAYSFAYDNSNLISVVYNYANSTITLGNTSLFLGSVNTSITGLDSVSSNTVIIFESVIVCNTLTVLSTFPNQVLDSFPITQYRSCKYIIQAQFDGQNYLTEDEQIIITEDGIDLVTAGFYQVSELLLLHDNDTAYITEYGNMNNGANFASFSASVSNNTVQLLVTPNFINTKITYTRASIA